MTPRKTPQRPNHRLPRHGSKSRSIARSVPGGRSCPAWTGTVVTHLPQRTRTCEPTCRTSTHPRSRSRRSRSLPVTCSLSRSSSALDDMRTAVAAALLISAVPGVRSLGAAPSPAQAKAGPRQRGRDARGRNAGRAWRVVGRNARWNGTPGRDPLTFYSRSTLASGRAGRSVVRVGSCRARRARRLETER